MDVANAATLYVSMGTRRAYELDTYRRRFWNFTEYTATGISSVKTDTNAPLEQIYDIDGRRRDTMHRGLNIVRSRGKVKEVMVE